MGVLSKRDNEGIEGSPLLCFFSEAGATGKEKR